MLANQSQQNMKNILHHGVYSRDPSIFQHPQINAVYHTEKMKDKVIQSTQEMHKNHLTKFNILL